MKTFGKVHSIISGFLLLGVYGCGASSQAHVESPRTTRISMTVNTSTEAAGPFDPNHVPNEDFSKASSYRIEPGAGGYDAIADSGPKELARGRVSDADVHKLVEFAKSLKICEGSHSPHNDPEIHFTGEIKIHAIGGLGLACAPEDKTCDQCHDTFTKLHDAVRIVVERTLRIKS